MSNTFEVELVLKKWNIGIENHAAIYQVLNNDSRPGNFVSEPGLELDRF